MQFVSPRFWIGFFSLLASGSLLGGTTPDYSTYNALLQKYSRPDGVLYASWHASQSDRKRLTEVLNDFGSVPYEDLTSAEATAFLINLYNAAMIDQVLQSYPIDSVQSIGVLPFSVFRTNSITLNGRPVSLDTIEKEILLKEYPDPRIHFAINCASKSCPPLRSEAFVPDQLDQQLDEQARLFANSPHAVKTGKSAAYSQLFQWYDQDFPGNHPADYLNKYRDSPLPTNSSVEWIEYDWSLNEAN